MAAARSDNQIDEESPTGTVSNVTIDNAGTISGGSALGNAGTIVMLDGGSPSTAVSISGVQIDNASTGTIEAGGNGVAINNTTNTSAVSISNSGTITGNVLFGTGGDTLSVTGGTITVTWSGRVRPTNKSPIMLAAVRSR